MTDQEEQKPNSQEYNADLHGNGAVAQGKDSLAVGVDGIGLKGDVGGNVIIVKGGTLNMGELKSLAQAQEAPAPGEPPYMGLRYFDTGDAALFHGRAALTRELAGNVYEWVSDWYAEYPSDALENPTGPESGSGKVLRGGSWNFNLVDLNVPLRYWYFPSIRSDYFGFRCSR